MPGAAAFLKYVASRGVEVFYITNREEQERIGTLKKLWLHGLSNADDAHLFAKQKHRVKTRGAAGLELQGGFLLKKNLQIKPCYKIPGSV